MQTLEDCRSCLRGLGPALWQPLWCALLLLLSGGFMVGARRKGSVRILPGPAPNQVSVIVNSQTGWTTVPAESISASGKLVFVRERRILCVFFFSGFLSPQAFIALLDLRREAHTYPPVAAVSPGLTPYRLPGSGQGHRDP